MIAKDEELYLKEWVYYYHILGFDEIIVYDNESSDNSYELLKDLQKRAELKHKLQVRQWSKGKDTSPQITAYRDAIKKCKNEWMLFVDADEFIVLHEANNINELLGKFADKDITAIGINWKIYGDSNLEAFDPRPLIERFTMCSESQFNVNRHIKTFCRTKNIDGDIHMHACGTNGRFVTAGGNDIQMSENWGISNKIDHSIAQINHYYCKTRVEFAAKIKRGQAGCSDEHPLKYYYNEDAFNGHNRNDEEDKSAQKYLASLQQYLKSRD